MLKLFFLVILAVNSLEGYKWVPSAKTFPLPANAVHAGRFSFGTPEVAVFVGRINHPGEGWLPVSLRVQPVIYANYAYHGREYSSDTYDVLTAEPGEFTWVPATLDCPPCAKNLLENTDFQIGRISIDPTSYVVGKIYMPWQKMYYPLNWRENESYHFECLCTTE